MANLIIHELAYDPALRRDIATPIALDYDPQAYKTKRFAARGLHAALVKLAVSMGQSPDEVQLWSPEQAVARYPRTREWVVVWEAGPYNWAIPASMQMRGPWGFTEPFYGFDLCFTGEGLL